MVCHSVLSLHNPLRVFYILKQDQPVSPKGNQSFEYSLEGLMLKMKLHFFGHLMQRANSLEKTLMMGKIDGRRRRR